MDDDIIQCSECGWPGAQTPPQVVKDVDECPLCGSALEIA